MLIDSIAFNCLCWVFLNLKYMFWSLIDFNRVHQNRDKYCCNARPFQVNFLLILKSLEFVKLVRTQGVG